MRAIHEMTGRRQVEICYVNGGTPGLVEENFEAYFLEHPDLSIEEVLQDQESLYQSLQANGVGDSDKASGSTVSILNHERSAGQIHGSDKEKKPLPFSSAKSQLELDEELAISLQELENQLGSISFNGTSGTAAVNREVDVSETSTEVVAQDHVDPDNMTYEELQSLGEAIGTESRGLPDELISYLPSYKYKTGFFKKEKHEECVICYMAYKNRDRLITLPCHHQYHSECITKWLKLNKGNYGIVATNMLGIVIEEEANLIGTKVEDSLICEGITVEMAIKMAQKNMWKDAIFMGDNLTIIDMINGCNNSGFCEWRLEPVIRNSRNILTNMGE